MCTLVLYIRWGSHNIISDLSRLKHFKICDALFPHTIANLLV